MLISRISAHFPLFLNPVALSFSYVKRSSGELSQLQHRILETGSFAEFYKTFSEHRGEFTSDIFSFSGRTLSKVLTANREPINFNDVKEFVTSMQGLEISSLTEQNLINLLSSLRHFRARGFNMYAHNNFKQQLSARYVELIKARPITASDLSPLINSLFELVSSNSWNESRFISEKILRLLEDGNKNERLALGSNQCAFLLHVLSLKGEFSKTEINLRSLILERVTAELATFKLEELVKIAISLNKMEVIDFKSSDLNRLKLILNKIFDNITELDEKSVFEFIRSDHICKYAGYTRIYEEFLNNIFNEIRESGKSRVSDDTILKVFTYLSSKIDIGRYDAPKKAKFFAFLERSAAAAAENENTRLFAIRLEDFVKNGFFQYAQRPQVVAMLAKNKLPTTMKLLYHFAIRGFNLEPFWEEVKEYKVEEMKHGNLARLAIIFKKLEPTHPEATAILAGIEEKFSEHYSTPEKFVLFYREFKKEKNQISLLHFSEALPNLGSKLVNPYETSSEDLAYRASFLDYVAETYRSRDYSNFLNKYDAQIKKEEVIKLIKDHLYESKGALEPQKQLIYLLLKRLPDIVSSKDKKGVEVINELLTKYNSAVVHGTIDGSALTGLYRLLHTMIRRMKDLQEVGLNYLFCNVLEKYLTRNYRNYHIEQNYRNLLRHVLNNLEYLTTNVTKSRLSSVAVQEALRLNILNSKMLEKVTADKFSLPYYDKLRFEHIKDYSFKPTIDKLNFSSLKVIFSNGNLSDYLIENEAKISELVTKSNNNELFNALVLFNQPRNPTSMKIYKDILALVVERITNFDRLDIIGYGRNTLDRGLFNIYGHRQVVTKIMDSLRVRIGSISLESHLEFLKFVNSQPTINPKEYFAALLDHVEKKEDETAKESLLMKLSQTSYVFKVEDVKALDNILSKNVFQGLSYFIAVEHLLTPEQRSEYATKLAEALTKATTKVEGEEKPTEEDELYVSKFNYQYLKKTYPNETATLSIPEASLHIYKFSIKPRFINVYEDVAAALTVPLEVVNKFGEENYILKIKNYVLVFLQPRKTGSYHEHEFLKRLIALNYEEPVKVICIGPSGTDASILDYLSKQMSDVLTTEQIEKLQETVKARFTKSKPELEEVEK